MAFRMKHWLGVVALSCALIALSRLPLDSVAPGRGAARTPAEVRHSALERELRDTRELLDQVRRAESLPAVAMAAAERGVSLVIPARWEASDLTAQLRERIRTEVRDLGERDPDMVVGYAYDGQGGGATGLAVFQGNRIETYVSQRDGTPYCLQVVVTRPGMVRGLVEQDLEGTGWSRRTGSLLGPCALYAKYGVAGPSIQEWLEDGGIDFAFGRGASADFTYPLFMRQRTFMAIRLRTDGSGSMESERCRTGEAAACSTIFLDPDRVDPVGASRRRITRRSPAIYAGSGTTNAFSFDGIFLLADLEQEFGPEAFRRFWTSDDEVTAAFRAAFGLDVGEWLIGWAGDRWGADTASPAPTLSATLGSLLLLSLMTGLAAFVQQRRRVA